MHLTKESEYALLGLAMLAAKGPKEETSLAAIAESQRVPRDFLAKIFQKMARHGLLASGRGRGGGYALARPPADISMRDVLDAVEGPAKLNECFFWGEHCADDDPCPLHEWMKEVRPAILSVLEEVTLEDYVADSPHLSAHLNR